jgi:hypothetical protein
MFCLHGGVRDPLGGKRAAAQELPAQQGMRINIYFKGLQVLKIQMIV